MNVAQVLCAAGPVDAVTNQALAWRRRFTGFGWGGEDLSAVIAPQMPRGVVRPLAGWAPGAGVAAIVVHYSGYTPDLDRLVGHGTPVVLVSHNVTPARWFWELEPLEGVHCSLAPAQLAALAARAEVVVGVSEFNAAELRMVAGRDDVEAIPVLADLGWLQAGDTPPPPTAAGPPPGRRPGPELLFVGRLAPHKRQDLLIRVLAELRRHAPDARLTLVGVPITPGYQRSLEELAGSLAPGAVRFENGIPNGALAERYRAADVFVCLSEHEGFCIPLLEALAAGLPVIARDAGAVGEVLGGAGLTVGAGEDPAVAVELIRLAHGDAALRAELARRAAGRLAVYDPGAAAARMRAVLERVAA